MTALVTDDHLLEFAGTNHFLFLYLAFRVFSFHLNLGSFGCCTPWAYQTVVVFFFQFIYSFDSLKPNF